MSTPANPQDPSGASTEKLPAGNGEGGSGRHWLSEQTQKALLAVTAGLALVLSIIALVVAIGAGDGHHGRGDGHGPMHGGPRMEQRGGGPMMGAPQGGGPQGGYYDQAPGQPGGQPDGGNGQDSGTTTSPDRN